MSELKSPIKSHDIPKLLVWGAWLKVKENGEWRSGRGRHPRLGKFPVGIEAIGEFTGVPAEGADKIAVTAAEPDDDII
jgi:hypothetical protein